MLALTDRKAAATKLDGNKFLKKNNKQTADLKEVRSVQWYTLVNV